MGIFNKLKDMLYYEEEEIISEEPSGELLEEFVPSSKKEEVKDEMDDVISERDLFKSEPTFKFPIIFDEEEFIDKKETLNVLEREKEDKKEERVHFEPSLIVSPVYGVLDKHYQKDEIVEEVSKEEAPITFESVRKKAFGTLEDDLERTMSDGPKFILDEEDVNFDLKLEKEEVSLDPSKVTIGDAEENFEDYGVSYDAAKIKDDEEKEETVETIDTKNKDDLFDMIDSMYEKEGDEI